MGRDSTLSLIAQLPEVYQPLYGFPHVPSSRPANGARMRVIGRVLSHVQDVLGRPLRILDLGSAQGYMAFHVAEMGHHVTGIETQAINVAVSNGIASEFPELDVHFIEGDVVDAPNLVDLSEFDVVLVFSVLHHVAKRDGHDAVIELVSTLADAVPHAIFEMARREEPMYWADALPSDPHVSLAPYPFVRTITFEDTHLSHVQRPVLYCSTTHALVRDALSPILSWSQRSHAQANEAARSARRFFRLPEGIAKLTARFAEDIDDDIFERLMSEMRREAQVLEALASTDIDAPSLHEFVNGPNETLLVRSAYEGTPLDQVVSTLNDDERTLITSEVLSALAALERHGLYHDDLRLWNVVYDRAAGTAKLIDHGSVSSTPTDAAWPGDAYYSLFVFLASLWTGRDDQSGLAVPRAARIDSAEVGPRVASLIVQLLEHPRDGNVFRDLAESWAKLQTTPPEGVWPKIPLAWDWLTAIEKERVEIVERLAVERELLERERELLRGERDLLTNERDALAAEIERLTGERDAQAQRADELDARIASLTGENEQLQAERSAARPVGVPSAGLLRRIARAGRRALRERR